ncbi:MAG: hypothetical protein HY920_04295 [Elusimicrobia bacterium]|nr:hypothetical protein [Elusimicrobiota bacterium]
MSSPTTGGAPPDKKKMFLLAGLGLVIIMVYKQMALSPPTPPPDAQSVDSGVGPVVETPSGEERAPTTTEEPSPKERIETAGQSWGRDPFIGDDTVDAQNTGTTPVMTRPQVNEEAALMLSGIAWSKNKAAAIINGQIVRAGDLLPVKGKKIYKVLSILKNRVILQGQDKTITLRVRGG